MISSSKLYMSDQVPEHFQESFILSGYRSPCSTASQCVFSVFQLTNETLNIWTHLIPAVYFGWNLIVFWQNIDTADLPYMMPLMVYMTTMCTFPFASMLAHIFNTMSDKARHVCFFVDYWALSLFGLGSAIAFRAYSFTESALRWPYVRLYVPGAALISVASLLVSCRTRFMKVGGRRKIIRFMSFAVPYLFDIIPILHRLFTSTTFEATSRDDANYFYARQFVFSFLSAFLYCSHVPERIFPGRFDIIGHSHQLFHVVSAVGSHDQMQALVKDSVANHGESDSELSCSWYSANFSLMIIVIILNSIIVLYYVNCLDSSNHLFFIKDLSVMIKNLRPISQLIKSSAENHQD